MTIYDFGIGACCWCATIVPESWSQKILENVEMLLSMMLSSTYRKRVFGKDTGAAYLFVSEKFLVL